MKMIQIIATEEEMAALSILRKLQMGVLSAALLAKEAARIGRGSERRAQRCLQLGEKALHEGERTVSFAHAVQVALEARKDRRPRTLSDFRYMAKRLMTRCPGLAERRVRALSPVECAGYLKQAFDTPRQQVKGHAIMSGIFRTAQQRGWCAANPMHNVEKPRVIEKEIPILTQGEIARLLHTAQSYKQGVCLPAVGLMLYAGLRPHEVARLSWADINLEHGSICIRPRHSKTGGARRVTILPPLRQLLQAHFKCEGSICPPGWLREWGRLHRAAGFSLWQPDILRHTFASHHLARFRSYAALQLEMGHRSAELLRTRYVNMPQGDKLLF